MIDKTLWSSNLIFFLFRNMWMVPVTIRWPSRRYIRFITTVIAHFDIDRWGGRAHGHATLSRVSGSLLFNGLFRLFGKFLSCTFMPALAIHIRICIMVRLLIGRVFA